MAAVIFSSVMYLLSYLLLYPCFIILTMILKRLFTCDSLPDKQYICPEYVSTFLISFLQDFKKSVEISIKIKKIPRF